MTSRRDRFALATIVGLFVPVVLILFSAMGSAQEAETAATETGEASPGITATEVQAFLGYWMLDAELGERQLEMGFELDEDFRNPGVFKGSLVSGLFGEIEASNLRRVGEKLSFDVNSNLGDFGMDLWFENQELRGKLADASGAFSADLVGRHSDRVAFEKFRIPPDESRLTVDENMVRLRFVSPPASAGDFAQIETVEAGEVVRFVDHRAIKLATDLPLRFGELEVPTGNVAENYPGVYSLWLKRTADGWSLVFNHKPDVWGTQYDPGADLGEVPLALARAEEASEKLVGALDELAEGGRTSTLRLTWGSHAWSTPFEVLTSGL